MTQYPRVPTWQEFLAHTRLELRYLADEYSLEEVRTDAGTFQVDFANWTTRVRAAGYSYGHSFALEFGSVEDADWWSLDELLSVRAIRLPERFGDVSQLVLISRQSDAFREFAGDVLRGDFSCIPALRENRQCRHQEGLEKQRKDHYERTVAKAAEAFAACDYGEFLRLVMPLESMWTRTLTFKVEIARKKLG